MTDEPASTAAWPPLLFWAAACACLLVALGGYGLFGTESRWAEIVREMRITGDYFHPTLNGSAYFDKPLLTYWLIALAAAVTGHLDEAVLRIPSAVAALTALAATISLGRSVGSERQARAAGWILLGMIGFALWARSAEADMVNLAAVVLAVAWYWKRRERPGLVTYAVFYAICFVGAQAKGLAAIALPLLVVIPDLLKDSSWKSHLRVSHLAGLIAGASLYVAPLLYADASSEDYGDSGLGLVFRENVLRYLQPFDHVEPFYVYFLYAPLLAFPWLPLVPVAVARAARGYRQQAWPARWLAIATALIFLFFTVSGSRRLYYILPILPFLALLIASVFDSAEDAPWSRWSLRLQTGLLGALAFCALLAPLARPLLAERLGWTPDWVLVGAVAGFGLLGLAPLVAGRRWSRALAAKLALEPRLAPLVASAALLTGGYMAGVRPLLERFRSPRPVGLALGRLIEAEGDAPLAFCGKKFPADVLFYAAPPELPRMLSKRELAAFLAALDEETLLAAQERNWEHVLAALPPGVSREPVLEQGAPPWDPTEGNHLRVWVVPPAVD